MEKRLISALALSVLIILAFQYLTVKPVTSPSVSVEGSQSVAQKANDAYLILPKEPEPTIPETESIVETEKYILTFSNVGGAIKNIQLNDKEIRRKNFGQPLEIVKIKNQSDYLLNIFTADAASNLSRSGYSLTRSADSIAYSARVGDWEITKKYILHKSKYGIELQVYIKNISGSPKDFKYGIIGGAGVTEPAEQDKRLIEVTANIDGKYFGYKKPKIGQTINTGAVKWTALKNKYFSIIMKPVAETTSQFYSENSVDGLIMGVNINTMVIQPGSSVANKFIMYAGPSDIPILKDFGYDFEETANYGFFGFISKALISTLKVFYNIIHSWGVAIILLSIFLNILLFPLTLKSFQSMQKMQALHPQMEKLKKLNKDNPQKLNKEIMELYKKYKINPFGGCLPMLLQMPIFIALYQALMKSFQLWRTKFLWIQDLSAPDAVKIPITLPILGNSINILPLIMVVAMVFQQKMSSKTMGGAVTEEQKQQQKMMLIIMPIMFGFIFYNMPSGLVLYWVVNTSLTIIEQMAIMKNTAIEA